MRYYIINIQCNNKIYKLGVSDSSNMFSMKKLDELVRDFLKFLNVHIVKDTIVDFQESNEKEFNELKHTVNQEIFESESYQMRYGKREEFM